MKFAEPAYEQVRILTSSIEVLWEIEMIDRTSVNGAYEHTLCHRSRWRLSSCLMSRSCLNRA